MSDYLKDQAAADALGKSLLPDDAMRHIVSCSAPIPAGKMYECLTAREWIVVKSIRGATARAAGARIAALEAENAELLAELQSLLAIAGCYLEKDEQCVTDARAIIEKVTGGAS